MQIKYKNRPEEYKGGNAANITFIVTDDCQLRCRYCYLHGKTASNVMSLTMAKRVVDYVLENSQYWPAPGVVFDFIGGEPLMEIELIDATCDYIKKRMYTMDHPWFDDYRFSLSTNGLLYGDKKVQRFIKKNFHHMSISISMDGTQEKHDRQRIFPDGSGSYDQVEKAFKLYISQFPQGTTKATVGRDDIKLVKESVLHLYSLGVGFVDMNVVFEDVWSDGDDLLFEEQLMALADAMVEKRLYENHSCSFFTNTLGGPLDPVYDNNNWCGTGKMLAVDQQGDFYPCNRFMENALRCHKPRTIGNIDSGINMNHRRAFLLLNRRDQSPEECMSCEDASGCAWCPAESYDDCGGASIYKRGTANCLFHKAAVRANRYYWSRIERLKGEG
jgi:uncharacterized protein